MTATTDRSASWPTYEGQIVTVFPAAGGRYYVQITANGRVRSTCDPHGYHARRSALRAARRMWPVMS